MLDTKKLTEFLRRKYDSRAYITLYRVGNKIIYELRSPSGGATTKLLVYFVCKKTGRKLYRKYAVQLDSNMTLEEAKTEIKKCAEIFERQVQNDSAKTFDPDQGDLGTGDNLELAKNE